MTASEMFVWLLRGNFYVLLCTTVVHNLNPKFKDSAHVSAVPKFAFRFVLFVCSFFVWHFTCVFWVSVFLLLLCLVSSVLASGLDGKNISHMTYFVLSGALNLTQSNQHYFCCLLPWLLTKSHLKPICLLRVNVYSFCDLTTGTDLARNLGSGVEAEAHLPKFFSSPSLLPLLCFPVFFVKIWIVKNEGSGQQWGLKGQSMMRFLGRGQWAPFLLVRRSGGAL